MSNKQDQDKYKDLRQQAQDILAEPEKATKNQQSDLDRILHELNVYQVELEIQNQELRQAQQDLAESRQELKDLFDFAPLGYLEINHDSTIIRANLMASQLFRIDRKRLIGSQITKFIYPSHQDEFYLLRTQILRTGIKQTADLRILSPRDKLPVFVNLQAVLVDENTRKIRISMTDISIRKRAEQRINYLNELDKTIFGLQSIKQISETALVNLRKFSHFDAIVLVVFQKETARINVIKRETPIVMQYESSIESFQKFLSRHDVSEPFKSTMPQLQDFGIANKSLEIIPIRHNKMLGLLALQLNENSVSEDDINLAIEFAVPLGVAIRQAGMIRRINQYNNELEELVEKRSRELHVQEKQYQLLAENVSDIVLLYDMNGVCEYTSPSITDKLGYSQQDILNKSIIHFLHPDEMIPFKKQAISLWLTGQNTIRLRHKEGYYLWFESQGKVAEPSDSSSQKIVTILRDVTDRVLAQQAEKQQRIFVEGLLDVTRTISSTLELDVVITQIFATLAQIIPYTSAFFVIADDDNLWHVIYTQNFKDKEFEQEIIEVPYDLRNIPACSEMFETLKSVIISDLDSQNLGHFKEREGVKNFLCVPILIDNRFGAMLNLMHSQDFYKEEHIENIEAFAEQASIAIRNAQLYERGQNLAALEERQYLARELHDAVSQTLFSAGAIAETLPMLLQDGQVSKVQDLLKTLEQLTTGARAEMRNLLLELRPNAFEQVNMESLINQLIQGFRARKSIPIHVDVTSLPDLSPKVKMQIFRITQGALNNIAQHADATEVTISAKAKDNILFIRIKDNGKGFNPNEVTSDRHGLNIMRERAEKIDATFEIQSVIGKGTQIEITLELDEVEDES